MRLSLPFTMSFILLDLRLKSNEKRKDTFRSGGLHLSIASDPGEMVGHFKLET